MESMKKVKFIGIDEYHIEMEEQTLSTTLGSCVSVCLWSPQYRAAAMNHFLLPNPSPEDSMEHGNALTEHMIKTFLYKGIHPESISAIVTGGGSSSFDHYNIGERNAAAAIYTLRRYGIHRIQTSVGGPYSRKLTFDVTSGSLEINKIHLTSGRVLSKESIRF